MKEFEKWAKEHINPKVDSCILIAAYDAWQAALEWVLENREFHIKDSVDVLIEKELEKRYGWTTKTS